MGQARRPLRVVRFRNGLPLLHWYEGNIWVSDWIAGGSMGLSDKQKVFCQEYIVDLNPRTAAKRAGFQKWRTEGPKLLEAPAVKEEIQRLMDERAERVAHTADDVLRRLLNIDRMDIADIIGDDGSFKPVKEWPLIWRTTISAFEVTELKSSTDVAGFLKKVKLPDKLKVVELIGRHINVSAFRENVQMSANLSGIDALHAMRVKGGVP